MQGSPQQGKRAAFFADLLRGYGTVLLTVAGDRHSVGKLRRFVSILENVRPVFPEGPWLWPTERCGVSGRKQPRTITAGADDAWGQAVWWRLPVLMANAHIRFAEQVQERLMTQGVQIGHSRVHELVTQAPARLTVEMPFALCRILDRTPSDLWLDLGQVAADHNLDCVARQRLRSATVVCAGEFF
ncbi:hypothetical protein [Streptomyces zagrosensis]|uniref:Uncharacterized protein n=1 Tax=Streptomyces zagrosensis TaxID=1042984 RepID=A0A7W9QC60_9ACTN|nr:hypothetical protein [Streptomyces zagrosensis]MBB5937538.1 hypothetical protein [Streptomyces zagrosensis]